MKVYVIAQESYVKEHLMMALGELSFEVRDDIPFDLEKECVMFIQDSVIEGMSDVGLRALFALHVMVLSIEPSFERANHFFALGAKGYGNAMMHDSHLVSAYQAFLEGNIWMPPEYIARLIASTHRIKPIQKDYLDHLSHREQEVALLLVQGDSHKEISEKLSITVRTVKAHASAIYEKLEVKDRLCLALLLRS